MKPGKSFWRWGPALALLIAFGVVAGARFRTPRVDVTRPHHGRAVQAVYATGTVEGSVMLPLAPRVAGRLMKLAVDERATVGAGDLLAELEDEELTHRVGELAAREELARLEYERQSRLIKKNTISEADFEKARSDWEAAKQATAAARVQLGYLTLRAPTAGTIIKRDGEVGEFIPVNQPIFWLNSDDPLRVSAEVDEEDISSVTPGQLVLIRADAFPGKIFKGAVESITPKGDPVARSFRVRIDFTEDAPLRLGMTTENNIVVAEKENSLLVPAQAVVESSVWVVVNGRLASRPVSVGTKGETDYEILEGLSDGDWIVMQPSAEFKDGQRVRAERVTAAESSPAPEH